MVIWENIGYAFIAGLVAAIAVMTLTAGTGAPEWFWKGAGYMLGVTVIMTYGSFYNYIMGKK